MRVSRVHVAQSLTAHATLTLTETLAHYLATVLRVRVGQPVRVFNSDDGEFAGQIVAIARHQVTVQLGDAIAVTTNPRRAIHLGLALARGERMDWAIQKATELGVGEVTPLITEHCEVRLDSERVTSRVQHWQRIAVSASEQCGRTRIPVIHEPQGLTRWFAAQPQGVLLDHSGDPGLGELAFEGSLVVMTGPEGGWSAAEVQAARDAHYRIARLGPRILRAETAPVVALALIQAAVGDF